jgi:hypothetical protein
MAYFRHHRDGGGRETRRTMTTTTTVTGTTTITKRAVQITPGLWPGGDFFLDPFCKWIRGHRIRLPTALNRWAGLSSNDTDRQLTVKTVHLGRTPD